MKRIAVVAFILSLAATGRAQPVRHDLDLSWKVDAPLLGIGLVGAFVPEFSKSVFAPEACRWCHGGADGTVDVNGFDRGLREATAGALLTPKTWKTSSDVFAFGLLPALSVGVGLFAAHDGKPGLEWATDLAVVAEAAMLAATVNQMVKLAAGRERPFVAYDAPYAHLLRSGTESAADDHLSFYSGHASLAASVTTAMARVIELRTGSKLGYFVLVPLGVLTGVMRMGADKHWATDVLTGLAVGAAAGYLVPTLHARPL